MLTRELYTYLHLLLHLWVQVGMQTSRRDWICYCPPPLDSIFIDTLQPLPLTFSKMISDQHRKQRVKLKASTSYTEAVHMQLHISNLLGTSIAASESAISTPGTAASAFFASAPFSFPASALFPFPISAPFPFLASAPLPVMASTSALALFSPEKEKHTFGYTHGSVLPLISHATVPLIWCHRHWQVNPSTCWYLYKSFLVVKHVSSSQIYHEQQHKVLQSTFLFKII